MLPATLYLTSRALLWFDLTYRIYLSERNRSKNRRRVAKKLNAEGQEVPVPKAVACVVGYREEAELFKAALTSYLTSGCNYLVVGIDGDTKDDKEMVQVFEKVVGANRKTVVINLNACVGQEFMEVREFDIKNTSPEARAPKPKQDEEEFKRAYEYMRTALINSGFVDTIRGGDENFAVCFTQPHRDLKEVRLAAWVMSIVVADLRDVGYLWSSDSDTVILPDTISSLTKIVAAEPRAAGGSALVQLNNAHISFVSRMAQTSFSCDAIMNRSANAAIGRSECLNGPGSLFRIAALRTVAAGWYRCQYPGSQFRSVLNEDMQVTMMFGKAGWKRLYSEGSIIQTAGPTNLKGWVGQRIRWSRGIHLHRVHDYQYVLSQGLLYTAYMVRSALYDPLLLIWTSYFAITGRQLVKISVLDVLALEVIPPFYNYFKSRKPQAGLTAIAPYLSYRAIAPAYRMYTFLTPGKDSWALPSGAKTSGFLTMLSFDPEMGFVYFWFTLMAIAIARGLLNLV
ncbi:uncharacterized protein L3040_006424 [Drepanopeziza brunnea f. sp. 'multigermtubi']|uniref:uncharacterized protein n=1 Tax=Drepanopeziza brunnea f. sp. 'multigermtubi' TaxID=698441 RepID=UPI0023951FC3|nr:hypothetical protein L3040_006424 [Drepanopeziza brunnea f. sp. 'multigermtubi']